METDLSVPLSPAFLKVTRVRAQVCPREFNPSLPRSATPKPSGRWASRATRPALRVVPASGPAPAPPPAPRPLRSAAGPPRSAPLVPPLRSAALSLGGSRGWRGSSGSPSCLHGDAASQTRSSELSVSGERGWPSWSTLRGIAKAGPPAGWDLGARLQRYRPRSLGAEFCIPEIPRNYLAKKDIVMAPKSRQNGRLLVFDPKENAVIEPNKGIAQKCCFGHRPKLVSKLCTSPAQMSTNVKTFSAKKEVSSKKIEDKISLKNTENRMPSNSIESKDNLTNGQSDLWSSSSLKEGTDEASKDAVLAKQEKNNEDCLQDTNNKLSDSTDGEGEDDTNDEDDEGSNTKKETRAPLELMAEFLRAEMGRDYQLAKKLCQMILIYEPENPVAKEFFSLIEEILLKEKAQSHEEPEEDEEDSEEDSSRESEGESSEDASDDSSDECEDGS